MKKILFILALLGSATLALGFLFRINHLDGQHLILIGGIVFIVSTTLLVGKQLYRKI